MRLILYFASVIIYAGRLGNYHVAPDASGENRDRLMASAIEDALALEKMVRTLDTTGRGDQTPN